MNRIAHNRITSVLCPDVPLRLINSVNHELDKPSATLGPRHRVLFHDPLSAGLVGISVALKMGYPPDMGFRAAQAHLLEDHASDQLVKVTLGKVRGKRVSAKHVFDALTA